MWLIELFFPQSCKIWYVEVRISRIISENPFEFEITRVDCTKLGNQNDNYFVNLTMCLTNGPWTYRNPVRHSCLDNRLLHRIFGRIWYTNPYRIEIGSEGYTL